MQKEALSITVSTSTCILVLKELCYGILSYFVVELPLNKPENSSLLRLKNSK